MRHVILGLMVCVALAPSAWPQEFMRYGGQIRSCDGCGIIEIRQTGTMAYQGRGYGVGSMADCLGLVIGVDGKPVDEVGIDALQKLLNSIVAKKKGVTVRYHPNPAPWVSPPRPKGNVLDSEMLVYLQDGTEMKAFELLPDEATALRADRARAVAEKRRLLSVHECVAAVQTARSRRMDAYANIQAQLADAQAKRELADATRDQAEAAREQARAAEEAAEAARSLESAINSLRHRH